jgi:hypothetical protein
LLPAIESVLMLFLPLKSYFQSQEVCSLFRWNVFKNPLPEIGLYSQFVHTQSSFSHEAVKKAEGQRVIVFELIALMG